MSEHIVSIDSARCIGCGMCVRDCVSSKLLLNNGKATILSPNCIKCGHCVAICPQNAVSISGYDEPPINISEGSEINAEVLLNALSSRRSVRQFTTNIPSEDVIEQIIQAGRYTPTAKNTQDLSYAVLQNLIGVAESLAVVSFQKLLPFIGLLYPAYKKMKIGDNFFFKNAPLAIVIMSQDKVSASLAAANMALVAESNGLGVLYSGFFTIAANRSAPLKDMLGISGKHKAVTTLVLGYPSVKYKRTAQREKAVVKYL